MIKEDDFFKLIKEEEIGNITTNIKKKANEFYKNIPLIPPKEAFKLLESKGYRGQEKGRKSLCLAAYRHVKRIKKIHLEKIPREKLPPRTNILLVGPTGCGKTYLIELLFKHILKIPTIIVDMTVFSETGYIGDDTRTILTRLLIEADNNPLIAQVGVICLDEFDKLSSIFSLDNIGSGKDVSGYGVQRELLKMLEDSYIEIPMDLDNSLYTGKEKIFTGDIVFIASGAFSNFKFFSNNQPKIGFLTNNNSDKKEILEKIAYKLDEKDIESIENFYKYGFIPELIARFNRIVPMYPLDRATLKSILIDNVVKKYQIEFLMEGIELIIEEEVLDLIVEKSLERQTGARGLGTLLISYLENAAFEYFCGPAGKLILFLKDNEVQIKWERLYKSKKKKRISRS